MISLKKLGRVFVAGPSDEDEGQRGFTLVEMLVVITIIGLIMSLIGPRVLNYLSESKVKAAKIQLQSFGSALDLFYLDAGRFPSTAEGLAALGPSEVVVTDGPRGCTAVIDGVRHVAGEPRALQLHLGVVVALLAQPRADLSRVGVVPGAREFIGALNGHAAHLNYRLKY